MDKIKNRVMKQTTIRFFIAHALIAAVIYRFMLFYNAVEGTALAIIVFTIILCIQIYNNKHRLTIRTIKSLDYLVTISAVLGATSVFDFQLQYRTILLDQFNQELAQLQKRSSLGYRRHCIEDRDFTASWDVACTGTTRAANKSLCDERDLNSVYEIQETCRQWHTLNALDFAKVDVITLLSLGVKGDDYNRSFRISRDEKAFVYRELITLAANKQATDQHTIQTEYRFKLIGFIFLAFGIASRFAKTTAEVFKWHT